MKLNYFNFKKLNGKILLTNDMGKYVFLDEPDFHKLLSKTIDLNSDCGLRLREAGMIYSESNLEFAENHEFLLRNAKGSVAMATSLHIFVVTTACNMNCVYCQANNGASVPNCYMTEDIAERAVDIALQSPEYQLSFEFQGGEPLLNFPVIAHIIEYAEEHCGHHKIEFNLVSNLTLMTDEILDFLEAHSCSISTSVDGPCDLHNRNRPFKNGEGTFCDVSRAVERIRKRGLPVGAIETTTRYSLCCPEELVHTYAEMGFDRIFIRHLTQLGKAEKDWDQIGYTADEFLAFYINALNEIIRMNKSGTRIREQHAEILLNRIKGRRMNYMELRSPCGGGIGQLAYYADGRIFTCDEGRMLAEMGNDAFLLGNVHENSYQELIASGVCQTVCASSMLETIPSCCDCVYQPYCGVCAVICYANSGDVIEKTPNSFRCQIYRGMLDYLFGLLQENDVDTMSVLDKWGD